MLGRLLGKQNVVFGSLDELPAEAARDRDSSNGWEPGRTLLSLWLPVAASSVPSRSSPSPPSAPGRMSWCIDSRLIAEVFANALARKEAEDALRTSELMKSAILASLTSSATVLDRQGRIVAVNES